MRHAVRPNKRLERLICSGLRSKKDLDEYAAELKQIAEVSVDPDFLERQSGLLKALANETRLKD